MLDTLFAGIWSEVWRYGVGSGLIILCLAAAYFSPVFKKDFLWAAAVIAVFLATFAYGVNIGETRVHAQWDASLRVAEERAAKAREDAIRDVGPNPPKQLRHDKFDRRSKP